MQQGFNYFDTPLASQTTAVKLMPNNNGFAISSIDGRANLTSIQFNNPQNQMTYKSNSIMTFKCHK